MKLIPRAFMLDKVLVNHFWIIKTNLYKANKNIKEQIFEIESVYKEQWWEKDAQNEWVFRELNSEDRRE